MKQSAKRRKWFIGLVALVAIVLLCLWVLLRPPLWYYQYATISARELPTRLIRPAFRWITEWDLPSKAEKMRAIFERGRDSWIFVGFQTDSEGVSYIQHKFAELGKEFKPFDASKLWAIRAKEGFLSDIEPDVILFARADQVQKQLGICILDQRAIESGLRLLSFSTNGIYYESYIDTQHNRVYIHAGHK
jgi:hypothetical protein